MSNRKRALAFLLTGALLAGAAWVGQRSSPAAQDYNTALQPLWLAAETESSPQQAVAKWEELAYALKQNPAPIDSGMDASSVSKMLFTAYLNANDTSRADSLMESWQGQDKIWAELLLARKLTKKESSRAWKFIAQAATEAQKITDLKQRSFTLHAVLSTALQPAFKWDGTQLAEELMPQILSPWHRADAMHQWAKASTQTSSLLDALRISDKKKRRDALLAVHKDALKDDRFTLALDALSGWEDANKQQKKIYDLAQTAIKAKEISRAVTAAERLEYDRRGAVIWGRIAIYFARGGQETRANAALARAEESAKFTHYADDRKEALKAAQESTTAVAKALENFRNKQAKERKAAMQSSPLKEALAAAKTDDMRSAVDAIKATEDARLRTQQFRILAEAKAMQTDAFGLLGNAKPSVTPRGESISKNGDDELEKSINTQSKTDLRKLPASSLGTQIPPLPLAENLKLTAASLRAKLPLSSPFVVERSYYANNYLVYSKFKVALGDATANRSESLITPDIIFLQRGTATLPQIYDALRAQGLDDYLIKDDNTYTLRHGLVVGQNATLVIDGAEVAELRQSIQHGAILVNAGTLHISDARLMSWDEETQTSPRREYAQKYDFRPFVASWSGSHTFVSGSEFLNLGYMKSKSFALTLTTGPKKMEIGSLIKPSRPKGEIVDNSFINAYYGFYSYEADKVALIGNEYREGVVYGIDPHDRSRELTMAYNTAYESQQKHGIIISRDVDNSSYIGNLSFDNRGSGFMLDRKSTGTYIYANTAFSNQQDGITLFESSCSLIASNHFFDNQSVGLRARNGADNGIFYNRFETNKKGGVLGYSVKLEQLASQATRDYLMDPYADVTAMTLIGNHIAANKAGILADNMQALTLRGNRFEQQSPKLFQGKWFSDMPYLSSQYDLEKTGVIITETCPDAGWTEYRCRFRESGIFSGDGQRDLKQRITTSPCRTSPTEVKS